jgi:DNA-binding LytR/AlgR family response regulator
MKCIIIDDEPLAREGMELNVQEMDFLQLEGQFGDAISAYNYLMENEVDLMFLDIQMPGEMTGLDLIKALKDPPLVILTTAYPEYAVEGFELNVVDYLVKPIRMQRFIQAVTKAREKYETQHAEVNMDDEDGYIYIKADRKFIRLKLDDIQYIKGMKDYVMVYTKTDRHMTAMNIKTIFNQLVHPAFVRISKSYIINSNYIKEVNQNGVVIGDEEIPLGKTYKEEFIERFIKGRLIQRKTTTTKPT